MDNFTTKKFVQSKFPKRIKHSNKSTYGRILNIAGCSKYIGAAYLSSYSALKSGAGYVTLASTSEVCKIIAQKAPELTFLPLNATARGTINSTNAVTDLEHYNVISLGCGISTDIETKNFIFSVLKERFQTQNIIIDADAINLIAAHKGEALLKNTVITPHPKELSRLLNVSVEEVNENREKYARIAAQTYECITVLKGYNSIITDGETLLINPTGNSALSKAGTGDVLTGIVSAIAAQSEDLFNAVTVAVYLHGLAGDIASSELTEYSVCATDVIKYIPRAIKSILPAE